MRWGKRGRRVREGGREGGREGVPALHAQHEGDGVHEVGLAAAIGSDDGRKVPEGAYHLGRTREAREEM